MCSGTGVRVSKKKKALHGLHLLETTKERITGLLIISSNLGKEGVEKEMRLKSCMQSHIKNWRNAL